MNGNSTDRLFMKEALRIGRRGWGRTSPNPVVGALVVRADKIVGRGYHAFAGGPHAEVHALREAGKLASGATLYVTLEPCNHHGRTPPCTSAVLDAAVSRVVVGMADPNPLVSGGGADCLRKQGVQVDVGILERECRLLNQPFIKYITTGLPHVTLKAAMTLDGRIAARSGESRWISNDRSRRFVHHLRASLDAVLVGIETALADDPQLTVRILNKPNMHQPVRIVVDSRLRLPLESRLAKSARTTPLWLACGDGASRAKELLLQEAGVEIIRLPSRDQQVDLLSLLQELGKRQITSLLVEGGSRILGGFIEDDLADEFYFFYAPKILGDVGAVPAVSGEAKQSMGGASPVYDIRVRRFGQDVMLHGRFYQEPL